MLTNAKAAVETKAAAPAKIGPSLPLDRYAGQYKDPWYGQITVFAGQVGPGDQLQRNAAHERAAGTLSV